MNIYSNKNIKSGISNSCPNHILKKLKGLNIVILQKELNKSLLKVINKHLMKLPITTIIPGSSADEYIDQILVNVQNYIKNNNLEPMELPDYVYNFTKEVRIVFLSHSKTKYFKLQLQSNVTKHV